MRKLISMLLIVVFVSKQSNAQNVGIGTTSPLARLHVADSNVIFSAPTVTTSPSSFTLPTITSGTRMMWMPQKSAFRVGTTTGSEWLPGNIGTWSFGAGLNALASGDHSTAIGTTQYAGGAYSVALGSFSEALGDYSLALGYDATTIDQYGIAMGKSCAALNFSTLAMGYESQASAFHSIAIGLQNKATGDYSVSLGTGLVSKAFSSIAIGRYNDSIASSNNTLLFNSNPIFYIGNGNNNNDRSNAVVVYKSGNIDMNGNALVRGNTIFNGNTDIGGFTQLGAATDMAPAIKMKELTATSAAVDGGDVNVLHGLTRIKIIGIQVLLEYTNLSGGGDIIPSFTDSPGYEYNVSITNTTVNILNKPGNCANILNKPVRILITYKE